jgi:hypothetical protein
VRIRALKPEESARFLNGLTGTVIGVHPLVPDWVKLRLDPNPRTPYRERSIPADRLIVLLPASDRLLATRPADGIPQD